METGQTRDRATVLWVVVLGVVLVAAVAVLIDAPSAAVALAVLCAALAVVRATGREPAPFRARSQAFDVTVLIIAALALVALAPAGYLT